MLSVETTTGSELVANSGSALQIHGWCLCLAWGWFIPAGIVIASFRSLTRLGSNWWYYLHISFQIIGLLLSLAGITVGTYFPANEKLMVQHKKIGIVVNVVAGLQVRHGTVLCIHLLPHADRCHSSAPS